MRKPIIALDADGVLLDYNLAYPYAWERAFGVYPKEKDPNAYWALDRWDIEWLDGERLVQLQAAFDTGFWENLPAMPGALEACHALHGAGHTLVCVSALPNEFESARLSNLRKLGFPIERVIATGKGDEIRSPKADALHQLKPVAFVDDFLPYMLGVHPDIHLALIQRNEKGSPNTREHLNKVASTHESLLDFARWWIDRQSAKR